MYTLENKVIIVTGGAQGIGVEIVKEFLKEHVKHLAFIDINEVKGFQLEEELRIKYGEEKVQFFKCDVTDDDKLFEVFNKVIEGFGIIDVVVNNAAICNDAPKFFKKEIEVNFTALVSSNLKALELMRTDHGGKGGTIINISSIGAIGLRSPNLFIYAATKSAVLHFSNCIGMEEYYCHTNVRVLTICFGGTDTDILTNGRGIDKITTEQFVNTIIFLRKENLLQSANFAAQGVVQSFKIGETGSTWLIESNRCINLTNNIKNAYQIMQKHSDI